MLIFLLLFAVPCFGDTLTTTAVQVLPDSARLTLSKVYTDVKAGMAGLAAALKVGAEHVYGILIRQQLVNSATNLLLYLISFLALRFCWVIFQRNHRRTKDRDDSWYGDAIDEHAGMLAPIIIGGILAIPSAIFFLNSAQQTITGFINPEYGAIMDIIKFVN